ncbi:hypothetical protein NJD98_004241 [Salmonella enterica]|nr:hypothetical protein [Salmonella enterica]EJL2370063.1 hypothetical protein [Salmonella enterica]
MRRAIYFFSFMFMACLIYSNGLRAQTGDTTISHGRAHTLPEVSIEGYKKELLEFQRLQRENEKLQLEEKNFSIRQRLQAFSFGGIESTKVVSIYTDRTSPGGLVAQIYNTREGMRLVGVGSCVMGHYKVIRITPVSVFLQNTELPAGSRVIKLSFVAIGAKIAP